jgi:threonyl-tRNA synthetase
MAKHDLETIRHSAAHVMAAAVKRLFDNVQFDIGPATEEGFYYDFDLDHRFTPEDLKKIEKEMRRICNEKHSFECREMTREEAENLLKEQGQTYKLERLAEIEEDQNITFYDCGDFTDLCRGPHVEHTGQIPAFKLLYVAGSYFHGVETNPMLQRIYGTAFPSKQELNEHLQKIEEAKKRDHRKLGKELDLFSTHDDIGPGLICWHPKGGRIRYAIENFWREAHYANGYELLFTPHVGQANLWKTSGHIEFYKDAMYSPMEIDEREYFVKPMNCPFHIEVYRSTNRSYRDLPLRWAELGTVYRYEKGGVLHGLLRVRGFTQDDAHIVCTPEQVGEEIRRVLRFCLYMWKSFGFEDVQAYLATRPEKAVGEDQQWNQASEALEEAIKAEGLECEIDEGGGAFYGPKIDLKIKDAIGREWQTSTIQFDFNLPERFDMSYVGSDGQKHRPYMIHRALLGSLERFFGILIEHYAGAFPLWLAPVQIRILPVKSEINDYAKAVAEQLLQKGFRVEVDEDNSTLGAKIRKARNERLPYMIVVGEQEQENHQIAIRKRGEGDIGTFDIDTFIGQLQQQVINKE